MRIVDDDIEAVLYSPHMFQHIERANDRDLLFAFATAIDAYSYIAQVLVAQDALGVVLYLAGPQKLESEGVGNVGRVCGDSICGDPPGRRM